MRVPSLLVTREYANANMVLECGDNGGVIDTQISAADTPLRVGTQIIPDFVAPDKTAKTADWTATTDEIKSGIMYHDGGATDAMTTPTAAQLVAAFPNAKVDSVVVFFVQSQGASAYSITGGTGVTDDGVTITASSLNRHVIRFTNVTSGSEACTIY